MGVHFDEMKVFGITAKQSTTGKLAAVAIKQAKPRDIGYKLSDGDGWSFRIRIFRRMIMEPQCRGLAGKFNVALTRMVQLLKKEMEC